MDLPIEESQNLFNTFTIYGNGRVVFIAVLCLSYGGMPISYMG